MPMRPAAQPRMRIEPGVKPNQPSRTASPAQTWLWLGMVSTRASLMVPRAHGYVHDLRLIPVHIHPSAPWPIDMSSWSIQIASLAILCHKASRQNIPSNIPSNTHSIEHSIEHSLHRTLHRTLTPSNTPSPSNVPSNSPVNI